MSTTKDISWFQQRLHEGSNESLMELLSYGPIINIDTWDLTQEWSRNLVDWLRDHVDHPSYPSILHYTAETLSDNAHFNDWLDAIDILQQFPTVSKDQATSDFLRHLHDIQQATASTFLFVQAKYHQQTEKYPTLLKQAINGDEYPYMDYNYCFDLVLDIQHQFAQDMEYQIQASIDVVSYWANQEHSNPRITSALHALDTPFLFCVLAHSYKFEFSYELEAAFKKDPSFKQKIKDLSKPDVFLNTVRLMAYAIQYEEEHNNQLLDDECVTNLMANLFKAAPKKIKDVYHALGIALTPDNTLEAMTLCDHVVQACNTTTDCLPLPEGLGNT